MVRSSRYAVRVRGFRLLCKQARWDGSGTLDRELEEALSVLQDEKPTAVRQALAALKEDVVPYKRVLWKAIRHQAEAINTARYPDSMQSLIEKDVQSLLEKMDA